MRTLLALLIAGLAATASAQQPNVLFIAVDDLRPELGCYGASHMKTPNIDSLASQGRLFQNHYVAVPTCGASRYALMTGLRPTAGTDGNNAFNQMPTSQPATPESWADLLRRNGWHTASIGKITHEPDGYRWQFPVNYDSGRSSATNPDMRFSWNEIVYDHDKWGAQRYPLFAYADGSGRTRNVTPAFEIGTDKKGFSLPDNAYPDGQMAHAAIDKLREFSDDGTRFCLAVGFHKPHLPFNAPKAYFDLYKPARLPDPVPTARPLGASSATTRQSGEPNSYTATADRAALRRAYFACVSYIDAQVGKLLTELDALGLADNTVVVLWGDHGWCLDDYSLLGKHVVLERGVHSPLIIRPPASLCPEIFTGVPAEGIAETIDLYPTIAELCGLSLPPGPQGHSLVPLLRNPFAPGKNNAYSRFGATTSVRTPDWRLIRNGGVDDLYDLSSFRYELADISASNPAVTSQLATMLSVQGTRPGTDYASWAGGNPLLTESNDDADFDGHSNWFEYASGTDALDPLSAPTPQVSTEDLTSLGLSSSEIVFSFTITSSADDLAFKPLSSTDLINWNTASLAFLDATELGNGVHRLRFRHTAILDRARFFRFSAAAHQ